LPLLQNLALAVVYHFGQVGLMMVLVCLIPLVVEVVVEAVVCLMVVEAEVVVVCLMVVEAAVRLMAVQLDFYLLWACFHHP
jgi:hypothetical protein